MLGRLTCARLGGGTWSGGRRITREPARDLERALVEVNFGRPDQRGLAAQALGALLPHVRDVRRGGSAASALAQVATGRADAYWGPGLQAWDAAAGILLVTEAGGVVGDLAVPTGPVWRDGDETLAADAGLWEEIRALLAPAYRASPAARA
jgi:myo-inositol-1(or 4)-monophosphatase